MGAGVAKAIITKWPVVKEKYIDWGEKNHGLRLGSIQAIIVQKDLAVINMIGQNGVGSKDGIPPVRYKAVEQALSKVANLAEEYKASIHVPYLMCCDLAGGEWGHIENMLIDLFSSRDIDVTVYDLYQKRKIEKG